ncbi:REEP5 [Symbiodinium sp. KB8]|nr:REEP5 [Symbiodinium sp. KB8]
MAMQENLVKALDTVEEKTGHLQVVKQLSEATGLRGAYVVLGGGLFILAFVFFGFGANFLVNIIGLGFPAYQSFKALETKEDHQDDIQWLTYWVVFSSFTVLETFVEYIVYFIPFYFALKLAFIVWLMLPGHNNAESLYKNIIRPLLVKYEVVIDETIERTLEGSKEVGGAVRDAGVAAAKSKQGREAIAAAAEVASDMVSPTADEEEETPATDAAAKKDL